MSLNGILQVDRIIERVKRACLVSDCSAKVYHRIIYTGMYVCAL